MRYELGGLSLDSKLSHFVTETRSRRHMISIKLAILLQSLFLTLGKTIVLHIWRKGMLHPYLEDKS